MPPNMEEGDVSRQKWLTRNDKSQALIARRHLPTVIILRRTLANVRPAMK